MTVDGNVPVREIGVVPGVHSTMVAALSHCIYTLRSVRRFRGTDVDPAMISFMLRHAVRAGSAKNRQPWRFVVVREPDQRRRLGDWYRQAWAHMADRAHSAWGRQHATPGEDQRIADSAELATHFEEAPVVIVVCFVPTARNPADFFGGASVYPAVQNLLLTARALGLGATLTTLQALTGAAELRAILDIPHDVVPAALIPIGWPLQPFPPGRRRPIREVTYCERWGHRWPHD